MKTLIYNRQPAILQGLFLMFLMLGLSLLTLKTNAQTAMKIAPGSQIKVNGTSNIHDWTMAAGSFSCDARFTLKQNQVQDVTALSFVLPVKNLKGKEDLLNSRAYKAMKEDAHKNISFKMTSGSVAQNIIKVNGTLTIAGVAKPVALQAKATVNADGTVTCVGSRKLKMSDHGIAPPSFMLGALKVVDDITIDFNLKLKK